jgi:hypothetical protein
MTAHRHGRLHPHIKPTFTAVGAALPAASADMFDSELEAITHGPAVSGAALDDFLSSWWRIATRAAANLAR